MGQERGWSKASLAWNIGHRSYCVLPLQEQRGSGVSQHLLPHLAACSSPCGVCLSEALLCKGLLVSLDLSGFPLAFHEPVHSQEERQSCGFWKAVETELERRGRETDSHRNGRGEARVQRRNVVRNEGMLGPGVSVGGGGMKRWSSLDARLAAWPTHL